MTTAQIIQAVVSGITLALLAWSHRRTKQHATAEANRTLLQASNLVCDQIPITMTQDDRVKKECVAHANSVAQVARDLTREFSARQSDRTDRLEMIVKGVQDRLDRHLTKRRKVK